ncbi:MAG: AAA family ATPase [Wolbachia sp.]
MIIEGAGGVLVPINKTILMVDLIKKLAVPIILVVLNLHLAQLIIHCLA